MIRSGLVFLILSFVSCLGWIWQLQEANSRAAYFEPVEAVVISNRIQRAWAQNSITQYRAEYELQYAYAGQTYRKWESDPIVTTQRYRAEAALGLMSPGSHVEVYVDPSDPKRMAMHISGWRNYFGAILFATLTTIFGLSGIVLWLKRREARVVYLS